MAMRSATSLANGVSSSLWLAGALLVCLGVGAEPAQARGGRHHRHAGFTHHAHMRHAASSFATEQPAFAAMVVDANTGRTLYERDVNELRHPASITKVMTLYMLFEQLERGRLRLDTEIPVSAHAASMAPTKLGLRAGSTIAIEDAIRAICTKSANDMAVAVAEAVGGDEDHFAEMMTEKAHALGMTRTHYANASGLPDSEQLTTAHDLIILGRSIAERFPKYYAFFSTHQFTYRGETMRNHNHLLDHVQGMDGIKTGYTRASGFNVLTSVRRGGRHLVSVVLGGASAGARDRIMDHLIEEHIAEASPMHSAPVLAEAEPAGEVREPLADPKEPIRAFVAPPQAEAPKAQAAAPQQPAFVRERARPAVIANAGVLDDEVASIPRGRGAAQDGSTRAAATSGATPTTAQGGMRWITGPSMAVARAKAPAHIEDNRVAKTDANYPQPIAATGRPAAARSGFMIQIGATDGAEKANALLARAKSSASTLAGATPFTEKVQSGGAALWRARFAGLSEDQADSACKTLKRSGFACFATKD